MSAPSPRDVRVFLRSFLSHRLSGQGHDLPSDLCDDCDLLVLGYIDSLGLLELMRAMTENFGREIDFTELDPEQMTTVGPLCKFVSEQVSKG